MEKIENIETSGKIKVIDYYYFEQFMLNYR